MAQMFLALKNAGLMGEFIIILIIATLIAAVRAWLKSSNGDDFGNVFKDTFKGAVAIMAIIDIIFFVIS